MNIYDYGKIVILHELIGNNIKPFITITITKKNDLNLMAREFNQKLKSVDINRVFDFICYNNGIPNYSDELKMGWWPNTIRKILAANCYKLDGVCDDDGYKRTLY